MGFGVRAGNKADGCLHRQNLPGRLRRADCLCGRGRQRGHQHQAAEAARIGAGFAVVMVAGRRQIAGNLGVAGDCAGNAGIRRRGAAGAEICDYAGKRNRISCRQRNNALSQRPLGEILVHQISCPDEPRAKTRNILPAKKFPRQENLPPYGRPEWSTLPTTSGCLFRSSTTATKSSPMRLAISRSGRR